jgi:hypothetical protein
VRHFVENVKALLVGGPSSLNLIEGSIQVLEALLHIGEKIWINITPI